MGKVQSVLQELNMQGAIVSRYFKDLLTLFIGKSEQVTTNMLWWIALLLQLPFHSAVRSIAENVEKAIFPKY